MTAPVPDPAVCRETAGRMRALADWLGDLLASDALATAEARSRAWAERTALHAHANRLDAAADDAERAVSPCRPAPVRDLVALLRLDRLPPHPPGSSAP